MIDSFSLRLGTRGSKLALLQAEIAARALYATCGRMCRIVTVKTTGDTVRDKPLAAIGGKALFAKEIEEALLQGEIDFAVHSLKDLPAELPEGLTLSAVLPREIPFDALVLPEGKTFDGILSRIGTGSVRRIAQARRAWPETEVLALRGNVDSRLIRLDRGDFDAVMLASAGLTRLGKAGRISVLLDSWLPALAQGAIGIETRADDTPVNETLERLNDEASALCIACERGFQRGLGGSCHSPVAGLARIEDGRIRFRGEVIAPDGGDQIEVSFDLPLGEYRASLVVAEERGIQAGRDLRPRVLPWLGP
jgi:hydroxymethylbilane synthase